jgi:hypothetical protein
LITPTFNTYGPYCQNDAAGALPSTSNNGITGTWSNQITTGTVGISNYTFTPGNGQCAGNTSINVVVNAYPSNQVSQSGLTLTALANNASYQWIDCNNNNAPISGAINQTYTTNAITGSYAVIISNGSCSSTSECFVIDQTQLNEIDDANILVYPNPTESILHISWNGINAEEIELMDASGRILLKESLLGIDHSIDVSPYANGVYFVKIIGENESYIRKFQKQELK